MDPGEASEGEPGRDDTAEAVAAGPRDQGNEPGGDTGGGAQSDEAGRAEPTLRERLQSRVGPAYARLAGQGWFRLALSAGTLFSQRRVLGLSAEAAFWATFTLPWLIMGLVAAVAQVAAWLGSDVTQQLRSALIDAGSQVLTEQSVDEFLIPLIDSTLQGSATLTVVGFLVALWSGSRIFATFVQGSEILNGRLPASYVHTRGIALAIYVLGLVGVSLLVVSIIQLPQLWAALVGLTPGSGQLGAVLIALPAFVVAITTMLFLADPKRTRWRFEIPGGVLAVALWLAGSWGLSLYFQWLFRAGSVYGAIGAPIAVMLWALVSVLAVFVGITCNATLRLARHHRYLQPSDPPPVAVVREDEAPPP